LEAPLRKRDIAPTHGPASAGEWRPDGTIEVEADTVADAMARVAAEVGEDAQIVDARKAVSGGIGGFFAKERVVLTARQPARDLPTILDRMSRAVDAEETEFGAMLRRQLAAGDGLDVDALGGAASGLTGRTVAAPGVTSSPVGTIESAEGEGYSLVGIDEIDDARPIASMRPAVPIPQPMAPAALNRPPAGPPSAAAAAPAPSAGAVAPDHPPWRVMDVPGGIEWGVKELVRRGLPERIVAAVAGIDPRDDLGWINAIAAAVAPLCGEPLDPDGVVVGPEAARLGELLEIPMVEPLGMAPYAGGFSCSATGTYDEQKWLDFVLAGRALHVVIDDSGTWGDLLVADPAVVSWVGQRGVASALHLAATLGARLGYAPADGDPGRLVRVSPVDAALAVRKLMRRR
jgi:hypothetical protein